MNLETVHYKRTQSKSLMAAMLLMVFLFAQATTLLHAEVHTFHKHGELCDVFSNLEKQPVFVGFEHTQTTPTPPVWATIAFSPQASPRLECQPFQARAPPLLHTNLSFNRQLKFF